MPAENSATGQELTSSTGTGTENGAETENQQTQQTEGDGPWSDPESARAEIEKLRKESAGYRTKLREAEPLAKKARELEDKDKSEQQKLSEQLAEAEQRVKAAEVGLIRSKVAGAKGLPAELAERLQGSTEEEIEEDADNLLKVLKASGGAPKADLKQGPRGPSSETNDVDSWIRKAAGRS